MGSRTQCSAPCCGFGGPLLLLLVPLWMGDHSGCTQLPGPLSAVLRSLSGALGLPGPQFGQARSSPSDSELVTQHGRFHPLEHLLRINFVWPRVGGTQMSPACMQSC